MPLLDSDHREVSAQASPYAVDVLRRLVAVGRGRRRPLIHLQHNPDPDAIASGLGMQYLLERLFGVEAVLVQTGQVGRAENRAMLRYLEIQIVPAFKVDHRDHDLVVVVDTHPGIGTCRLPPGVTPDIVVDHHPAEGPLTGVALPFLDPGFGATATMVGFLLLENGFPVPQRVATALVYGIKTDTQDLSRVPGPHDERVYRHLHGLADKRTLGRIERARLPQQHFVVLERGLREAVVTDTAITTWLGDISHGDIVAEVADLLIRLEGMRWSMVAGAADGILYASLRAIEGEGIDAGAVAREISRGQGGGHETFAALQVPLRGAEAGDPRSAYETLRDRFLTTVRAKRTLARPLTLPPDAPA
jgi:nanoRNase/pAp phosphatase (c-di-AMP/oligoRNAs hydrolase)